MPVAEAELRPTKAQFHLTSAEAIIEEVAAALGQDSPKSAAARSTVLAIMRRSLAEARKSAEAELMATGRGTRCAQNLSAAEDEIIRAIHLFAIRQVYPVDNPSGAEAVGLAAVGGYGRGTLAPGSDIDLLFILPYKQTPWGEQVTEYILYMLWDLGQKVGHAVRSVDECIRMARADMTVRTATLEARYLTGEKSLFDTLQRRFESEIMPKTGPEFIAAKMAEREERHRQMGNTRYVVEPNIKDGKGGLRDLHTLFWIGKYFYRVKTSAELVDKGVLSREEFHLFQRAEDFLWAIRCNLHFLTGRADEKLTFEVQPDLAQRLGFADRPGMLGVERMMKRYFLVAKDIGDLTRIFCTSLEFNHAKPLDMMGRVTGMFKRGKVAIKGEPDFVVDSGRLNTASPDTFERAPLTIIKSFLVAGRNDLLFHPDAIKEITRSLRLIGHDVRNDQRANEWFLEILTSPRTVERILRQMNESGVLGKFVPEFGKIVALMQFNMYHHYTVDEHLLRCIGILSEIERKVNPDNGLANELMGTVKNRNLLYVALLLHDIAKGRPEDHSVAGARIARRLCPRLGMSAVETETVAWLVEQHLVMSTVAQSRDLSDRKTIENFAAVVQNLERLKLLTILTTADIKAVGPGTWNGWKAQLLRTLYYETELLLTGGFSEV
ncbi:MAG: [protein-PII] uridylyltransferase, partial [Devosia sp.]|nr:[protein-PII] uridylyltransferase [Devosia sp.]